MTEEIPVGTYEIAERFGVSRKTVDMWRERHDAFPAPAWQVGNRPAWKWSEVREWGIATGRLTLEDLEA